MSDSENQSGQGVSELDILNSLQQVDMSKIETSYPLLATGIVQVQIVDLAFSQEDKKDGTGSYVNAKLTVALAQPWKTVAHDGAPVKEIQPGFKMTKNIYCSPVEGKDGKMENYGLQELTLIRECIYGKAPEGTTLKKEDYIGQIVTAKLEFNPAPKNKKTNETYGPRTEIVGWVRKAKS